MNMAEMISRFWCVKSAAIYNYGNKAVVGRTTEKIMFLNTT